MMEPSPETSLQFGFERFKERLRQQRQTFDQHKAHENRWFLLRLVMGYSSVVLLLAFMVVSSYILFNHVSFPEKVITAAAAAFFVDLLGLIVSIWKLVLFNPDFMTKLAPTTKLGESEARFLDAPRLSPSANENDLIIFSPDTEQMTHGWTSPRC